MNYRVILSVLFGTLFWRFVVTSAQNNKTVNLNNVGGTNSTNRVGSTGGNATVTTKVFDFLSTFHPVAIHVAPLGTTITEKGCSSTKLCAAQPSTCDPSSGNQCYFISAKQQSGQLYNFELSGQTDGYVAAVLSTDTGLDGYFQVYVCVNNSGVVVFYTGSINNFNVNLTPLNVSNVKGAVSSGKIQCTFGAILPNSTQAAAYSLSVLTGSYNAESREPGFPYFRLITTVVNLSNPNATITILINSTNSTSGAYPVAHQQSLMMPALLLTVIIMIFTTQ